MRLPAERPRQALERDEALLEAAEALAGASAAALPSGESPTALPAGDPAGGAEKLAENVAAALPASDAGGAARVAGEAAAAGMASDAAALLAGDAAAGMVGAFRAPGGFQPRVRWWVAASPALVVGIGLRHRLGAVVDLDRCRAAGVEVLARRAGGGAVLVDQHLLCGAVCVPNAALPADVTESYRWLGDDLAARLRAIGLTAARRVDLAEARADVAALRARADPLARLLLACCYGSLSPHEVVVGGHKLVGLAQVRRRHASLFQFGVLLRDQSALADLLAVDDEALRAELRAELGRRTAGLNGPEGLGGAPRRGGRGATALTASAVAAAIVGARPCEP